MLCSEFSGNKPAFRVFLDQIDNYNDIIKIYHQEIAKQMYADSAVTAFKCCFPFFGTVVIKLS